MAAPAASAADRSILVLGDSVSAAFGIPAARGWVALLAQRLKQERLDYSVVNASISGETTAGGLARLAPALQKSKPAVVIVELGGNDGLRGMPVAQMKQNLAAIAAQSKRSGARVLIVGVQVPPNYGAKYAGDFEAAFGEVAKAQHAALVPFLFEGFGDKREMFQPDGIHPTAAAQPMMLETIWQRLRPLLR